MKTIVLHQPGELSLIDASVPTHKQGEALVRVRRIGVCGTDIHAYRGVQPFFTYPRVLGHELGVEVVAVDENDLGIEPGARCAVEPYLNCGACIACRNGKTNCCVAMRVLGVSTDGGMRELIAVRVEKLHRSDSLSLDQLALVEPLSIGAHAVARAVVVTGERALVIGAGPIGLAVTQFALAGEAQVIVADVSAERLRFCREQFGVETINVNQLDLLTELESRTAGELPTLVFDATGNAESMQRSFQLVAHGGRLVFVGLIQGEVTFDDPDFHRRELTLLASRNALSSDFRTVISLLEAKKLNVTPWVTHRAPLNAFAAEFETWTAPGAKLIKGIIEV